MENDSDDDEQLFEYHPEHDFNSLFNYEDQLRTSPLLKAIANNDIGFIKARIESGEIINIPNNYGNTPLHAAAVQKNMEILNLLLELSNIDLNFKNVMGDTPLLMSIKMHQPDCFILRILETNCDINIANNVEETPLHLAVTRSTTNVAIELIKRKANIDAVDENNYTPLHNAVMGGNIEMVCMLLYYNADVGITCYHNLTPFMYAVNDRDTLEIANILFNYCGDFSCITTDGYSALLLAANSRNPIAIDIAKAGADVNWVAPQGNSAISFALYYDNSDLFKTVWPKFDHQNLLVTKVPFLFSFISFCPFLTSEWVECMYEILSSSFAVDIIAQWTSYIKPQFRTSSFKNLAYALFERKVKLSDRLTIIQAFLSLGAIICVNDINIINELFGFNEELEIIISFDIERYIIGERSNSFPLPTFIFALEENYSGKVVAELFTKQILHYTHSTPQSNATLSDIVRALGFFSFPQNIKDMFLEPCQLPASLKDAFLKKLVILPEFPSLVELTRNQVRKSIKETHNIKWACQFHNAVNNLNIPPLIKNIIRFKSPIYG